MFRSRRGRHDHNRSAYDTVISKDVSLQGTIHASGLLRIDGKVQGKIEAQGDVVIGKDGSVEARVRAVNLVIAGLVQGDVDVSERLHILPGGRLFGDAKAGVLVVEEGAVFKGQCEMELRRPGEPAKRISRRVDTTGASTPTGESVASESADRSHAEPPTYSAAPKNSRNSTSSNEA